MGVPPHLKHLYPDEAAFMASEHYKPPTEKPPTEKLKDLALDDASQNANGDEMAAMGVGAAPKKKKKKSKKKKVFRLPTTTLNMH